MKVCQKTLQGFVEYLVLEFKIKLYHLITFSLIVFLELCSNHIILTSPLRMATGAVLMAWVRIH